MNSFVITRFMFRSIVLAGVVGLGAQPALAADQNPVHRAESHSTMTDENVLADSGSGWPSREQFVRVVSMRDYNVRIVAMGTLLLGICGGVVGTFMLLRKRSLVGDVVSHASLPGVAVAFIVMELTYPGGEKSLPALLSGALVAGLLGVLCTVLIRQTTRIKEDAAMAIVLSVFFGMGIVLLTIVQSMPTGNQAGLQHFIYGQTALMIGSDVILITIAAAVVLLVCGLLHKEFSLLCFDEDFAAVQGWPIVMLDLVLMALVVGVTIIGLQSVGLLLVVAMLIIPATAARFWTDHLGRMTLVSAVLGGLSAILGVLTSALFPRLAAGAVIVLVGSLFFLLSMFFGVRRGVMHRVAVHWRLKRRVGRHHLLRAFYECLEPRHANATEREATQEMARHIVEFKRLQAMRSWTPAGLRRQLSAAGRAGLVRAESSERFRLTEQGAQDAARVVRNHRLWEMYLIQYADIAPSHVDRDADQIEHVLEPDLIEELDALLSQRDLQAGMPPSPHEIDRPTIVGG